MVEVPKYVEVEKKVPVEIVKEVPKEVVKTVEIPVPKIVEQPVYIEKPIYIDKPVEIERRVDVPIEVPVEVPVYVDKPVVDEEFMAKYREMEMTLEAASRDRVALIGEVEDLKKTVLVLRENLEVMRLHNEEKNRSGVLVAQQRGLRALQSDSRPPGALPRQREILGVFQPPPAGDLIPTGDKW